MIRHISVKVLGQHRRLFKCGDRLYIKFPCRYPSGDFPHWRLWLQVAQRRFLWFKWWAPAGEKFWLEDDDFDPVVEYGSHEKEA